MPFLILSMVCCLPPRRPRQTFIFGDFHAAHIDMNQIKDPKKGAKADSLFYFQRYIPLRRSLHSFGSPLLRHNDVEGYLPSFGPRSVTRPVRIGLQ